MSNKNVFTGRLVIKTKRLALTQMALKDTDNLFKMLSDKETAKYVGIEEKKKAIEKLIKVYLKRSKRGEGILLKMATRKDNNFLGFFALPNYNDVHRRTEIGYTITKENWNKGYVSEAILTAVNFLFKKIKLNRLEAMVHPNNKVSLHLLNKFGFKKEGLVRQRYYMNNKPEDMVMLSLLREEWNSK